MMMAHDRRAFDIMKVTKLVDLVLTFLALLDELGSWREHSGHSRAVLAEDFMGNFDPVYPSPISEFVHPHHTQTHRANNLKSSASSKE